MISFFTVFLEIKHNFRTSPISSKTYLSFFETMWRIHSCFYEYVGVRLKVVNIRYEEWTIIRPKTNERTNRSVECGENWIEIKRLVERVYEGECGMGWGWDRLGSCRCRETRINLSMKWSARRCRMIVNTWESDVRFCEFYLKCECEQ